MVRCAICYHVHNLKNRKNTNGRLLLLVKLQAKTCNFTKSNTPPWVCFTFFKLSEWYLIAQSTTYVTLCTIWYRFYNLKSVKNIHAAKACNFTKSNTPPWVIFTFFKLYKLSQIAQRITYVSQGGGA